MQFRCLTAYSLVRSKDFSLLLLIFSLGGGRFLRLLVELLVK